MTMLPLSFLDFTERRLKPLAKATYQPIVIATMRSWRRWHRRPSYIGITGSAGKTTAKDLLHAALAAGGPTIANSNSNNQLYAIARTLLALRASTAHVVQELGASRPGGLRPLLALLQPTVGVVLNVGLDHRKAFRDGDAIAKEKSLLIAALPADGLAVLNADDARVAAMASLTKARVVRFGFQAEAELCGRVLAARWPERLAVEVTVGGVAQRIETSLYGTQQATSVLAAVATAYSLGVPLARIAERIASVAPLRGRMSLERLPGDISVLRDDWKAPVWSLETAFQILRDARAARRLIVLGTLSDYPGSSRRVYLRAIRAALECAEQVILVGERADRAERFVGGAPGSVLGFRTVREAAAYLAGELRAGDLVLLKGSNTSDHLARIPLALAAEVGCWRTRCGRQEFCDDCGLLRQRVAP